MTRDSIREYAEAVRGRYFLVAKKERGKILDEFTKVTGCHRKAAIRLFRRGNQPRTNKKRGRPRRYGANVAEALRVAWEATDRLCSKRLHPFLPELSRELEGIMRGYLRYLLEREVKSTAWLDMLKG